jgi:hypothetical protein
MEAMHMEAFRCEGGGKLTNEQRSLVAGQQNAPRARRLPKTHPADKQARA